LPINEWPFLSFFLFSSFCSLTDPVGELDGTGLGVAADLFGVGVADGETIGVGETLSLAFNNMGADG